VALLELEGISAGYGAAQVLRNVSLAVNEGEIVSLIGANGAGKTTTLRVICSLLAPKAGHVQFNGDNLTGLRPFKVVRKGISLVPEGRRLFPYLTVKENLQMGAFARADGEILADVRQMYKLFPILAEKQSDMARNLSGGQQQMLAIARALMARPKLVLMDEPSQGLANLMVDTLCQVIEDINRRGVTILLVEQNARMALELAKRAYVLRTGEVVAEGDSASLHENELVRKAYLGGM